MLAAVGAMALFTALGFWQLERAGFKRALNADFAGRDTAEPVPITDLRRLPDVPRFHPVRLTGRFDPAHQIYLDNRVWNGRPGVEVHTPFRLPGGGTVLINRGWLPMPASRRPLPEAPAPAGQVTVTGLVSEPPAAGIRLGEPEGSPEWPWLTPYLTIEEAEAALRTPLAGRVILLGEGQPYGFERHWQPVTMPAERHVGYAVQWFALAIAVAAVWLVLAWRARRAAGAREDAS